jgi:hypothetical protein
MCMILCVLEMFRGQLDAMEPLVATSEKDEVSVQAGVKWGAQKMIMHDPVIGGVTGFGVQRSPDQKQPASGFGALPGSGINF